MEHRFKKSNAEVKTIKAIQFGVISPEFLKNISVTQSMEFAGKEISKGISHDICYDPSTGQANLGAINDPRMGLLTDNEHCGYPGHIELVRPVYHIGFLKIVIDILRCVSYYTSELLVNKDDYIDRKGRRNLKEITKLSKTIKKCPITQKKLPTYTKEGIKIAVDFGKGKEIISPTEVRAILEKISDEDAQILGLNTKYTRPEWLVLTTICVPPPHVRPSVFMSSSQKCDDDLTTKLNEIVKTNIALGNAISKADQESSSGGGGSSNEHFINQLESLLQYNISTFIDNQHPGQPPSLQRSGKPLKTLRERLAGKDGRVRGNLMGKRVDFSARTVITADPNLSLNEVGVPRTIAMNLTVPVVVTDYNKTLLEQFVKNGPNVYPGAKFVIKTGAGEGGSGGGIIKLDLKFAKITELKNGWVVERHLIDGDEVVFNRQPSLHRMSMMGHKAKILEGLTFRLNLAYTGAYNADFDGDEMNLHVPQSLTARAEVDELMMVDRLIVSPQANKPVIGIVQDSLLSSCIMTRRNTFIGKELLMNLIMHIDNWNGVIPKPAVIKYEGDSTSTPVPYWTGKQVFSLILPKSLNVNNVRDPMNENDSGIMIMSGQIISGSVDKSVIGKSNGGLIHVLFNDLGSGTTRVFINQVQKLSNYWIKQHGFTVGVGDAVASDETNAKVRKIIETTKEKVKALIEGTGGADPRMLEELINTELNGAVGEAGRAAQEALSLSNNFKSTVGAGSKGSVNNIAQIMAIVGQQNVEGRRIKYGFKHRTLPHYPKRDLGQESRGFVENNYLKGLTPQEFFFHSQSGREGLIDTSCRTSSIGYSQHRLVKALEDLSVKYDNTVRNSKGLIIQFLYGEDGIDATYMESVHIDLLKHSNDEELERSYKNPNVPEEFELITKLRTKLLAIAKNRELNEAKLNDDYFPMPVNIKRVINYAKTIQCDSNRFTDREIYEEVCSLSNKLAKLFDTNLTTNATYSEKYRSENATKLFRIYLHSELCTLVIKELGKEQILFILKEIEFKFKKAIVHPGEMCGILAAQSIGELTTQLTLNSFHSAGISQKSTTLGVPRLNELINLTKKPKTPSLTMYVGGVGGVGDMSGVGDMGGGGINNDQKRIAEEIRSKLEYKTLQDIIVSSDIVCENEGESEYEQDHEILELYQDLYSYTEFPIPDNISSSFSSLRFQFSDRILESADISLLEISSLLENLIGNGHKVICSDDNDDNLFIRIICAGDGENNDNTIEILRKIEIFCMSIKIKGYEGIERVYTKEIRHNKWDPSKGHYAESQWILETDGSNLVDTMDVEEIDHTKTISNNIIEIYEVFGIEAARLALLNELRTVLSFDGSYVNYRHLSILVDAMTCRGSLTAMTRHGINRIADTGILTKCSFEETVEVLTDAAAFGEMDGLKGISDNIMLGQTIPAGTGVMDLIYDPEICYSTQADSTFIDEDQHVGEDKYVEASLYKRYVPSEPNYPPLSMWIY